MAEDRGRGTIVGWKGDACNSDKSIGSHDVAVACNCLPDASCLFVERGLEINSLFSILKTNLLTARLLSPESIRSRIQCTLTYKLVITFELLLACVH